MFFFSCYDDTGTKPLPAHTLGLLQCYICRGVGSDTYLSRDVFLKKSHMMIDLANREGGQVL